MMRKEREEFAKCMNNFYKDTANQSIKTTVIYFKKYDVPERTIRYRLKKYLVHDTTEFLP